VRPPRANVFLLTPDYWLLTTNKGIRILTNHEGYKEVLPLHALDALEAEEARALEAHLATCAQCRTELDEWRETAAALAYSAASVEPSAQLRARLLESVREHPQSSNIKSVESEGLVSSTPSKVVDWRPSPRRLWSPAWKAGAIAASILSVALLIGLLLLWNRNSAMRTEIARLSSRVNKLQGELQRERESKELIATRARQDLETILNASTVATLKGTEVAPQAHARLAYDPHTGRAVLLADNLPPAPVGFAYQLWFIAGDKPLPGTVFTPDAGGHAEVRDQAPAAGRNATVFAVTLEPSGGVSTPTGDKYLLGAAS
jgi:anti-sigma-K factor RskA